ncbi:MAG: hypothetical protein SGPRY_013187 [Prymnesium sp.]
MSDPALVLYYFDIVGKGEPIRLLAAYARLPLHDHRFSSREEFMQMRDEGKLPYGQVPLLEVKGKGFLPQSCAILRYLAKMAGGDIYPSDEWLAARVDAAMEQEVDAFTGPTVASYTTRFGIELDDDQKEKAGALISEEVMPRHLRSIEAQLEESKTGWIAGTPRPSPADFVWAIPNKDHIFTAEIRALEGFPACRAFVKKFYELPEIVEYYANKEK